MAVFSTDLDRSAESILARFVLRWNVEVTFEVSSDTENCTPDDT
jgi:hypothetical protein